MIASLAAPLARWTLALLAAFAALATGCGPTTGGTGTGTASFSPPDFGASAQSLCATGPGVLQGCATLSARPGAEIVSSEPIVFTGVASSGPWVLTVRVNAAELKSRCSAALFEGEWGQVPGTEPRFYGSWVGPERGAAVKAQLSAVTIKDLPDGLQLLVLDTAGAPLFGPVQVRRVAAEPTDKPQCP